MPLLMSVATYVTTATFVGACMGNALAGFVGSIAALATGTIVTFIYTE